MTVTVIPPGGPVGWGVPLRERQHAHDDSWVSGRQDLQQWERLFRPRRVCQEAPPPAATPGKCWLFVFEAGSRRWTVSVSSNVIFSSMTRCFMVFSSQS